MQLKFNKTKGQTLLEILTALFVASLILIAIYGLIRVSEKTSKLNRQKLEAAAYVQDALEKVRNRRDSDLRAGAFSITAGDYRVQDSGGVFSLVPILPPYYEVIPNTNYRRYIHITSSTGQIQVAVKVTWNNDKNKVEATEILTNWIK